MTELTGHNWRVLHGDCREAFRSLPAQSVHCIVTSPPYWGMVIPQRPKAAAAAKTRRK